MCSLCHFSHISWCTSDSIKLFHYLVYFFGYAVYTLGVTMSNLQSNISLFIFHEVIFHCLWEEGTHTIFDIDVNSDKYFIFFAVYCNICNLISIWSSDIRVLHSNESSSESLIEALKRAARQAMMVSLRKSFVGPGQIISTSPEIVVKYGKSSISGKSSLVKYYQFGQIGCCQVGLLLLYTLEVLFSNVTKLPDRRKVFGENIMELKGVLLYHGWSTFPPVTYPPQKSAFSKALPRETNG